MNFDYDRRPALVNLVIWIIAGVWLLVLLSFLPEERLLFMILIGGVLAVTVLIVGVSPLMTHHEIVERNIVIRQGWHSWMVVHVDQVKRIQKLDKVKVKEGVLLDAFNKTLVLTGSKVNGMRIELKDRVRVPSAFWKKVDVVIFDVNDPDRFIAEFSNAL